MTVPNMRELALDTLLEIEKKKEYPSNLSNDIIDQYKSLDIKDKSFYKRLVEGTVERKIEMDYILDHFSKVPVKKMKPLIRCLMRMGVYQLLYMDNIPESAAINEAVKLADKRGFQGLKGFVNGVLRNIARQEISYPEREKEPLLYLSVKYSMPEWIITVWQNTYGWEITEKILEGLLRVKPVTIRFRFDLSQGIIQNYIKKMVEAGVHITPSPYFSSADTISSETFVSVPTPYVYYLSHMESVTDLPGYREGAFIVQDVSSILCVEAAGIRTGHRVMDICAAPGGKSILASEKGGKVLARDISSRRILRMEENRTRLKAEGVEIQQWDAKVFDPARKETADILLLDVPCSGLGVSGKKNDIKYNITIEKMKGLVELQQEIIRNSWQYVKPGGILIYSTCTIHEDENEAMYQWILREFPFVPDSLQEYLPPRLREEARTIQSERAIRWEEAAERAGCIQLLPGFMEADGFFIARMRRV